MELSSLFPNRIDVQGEPASWAGTLPGGGGVYVLADEQDRLILLASGESLRRIITFRLAPPQEASKKRADLAAITRRIYWQRTYSAFETNYLFHRTARTLMPDRYLKLCSFGACWFLTINPADTIPRWAATRQLSQKGLNFGPFPTRAGVEQFTEILDDLFSLCRYYSILEQVPNGQPCAYFEMGKCPAPCNGRISMDEYRRTVSLAADFAGGNRNETIEQWQTAMYSAARRQQFEQAEQYKRRIKQAEAMNAENYRFVRPIDQFNYLILQRAEGRARIQPFFVRSGWIQTGEPVSRKDLPNRATEWIRIMRAPPEPPAPNDIPLRSEWIWLVSHYLFHGERTPGLFLAPEQWPQADQWLPLVQERVLKLQDKPDSSPETGIPPENTASPESA